jgi:hypothetical protein
VLPRELPDREYHQGVLEWMNFALDEGLAANQAQFNYDRIGTIIDSIMGVDELRVRSPKLSRARINRVQKIALEMRSMLTDIKPFWEYKANCKRYEKQAEVLGKLARHWYLSRGIDQVFRDSIDYVLAAGTGYIHLYWNPDIPGPSDPTGRQTIGDIDARAEDPRDVIPIRFNGDKRSVQNCRGVIIRRERPTSWIKQVYGEKASKVESDRTGYEKESPSQRRLREAKAEVMGNSKGPYGEFLFGGAPAQKISGPVPVTDEFTCYIHDFSVNKSSKAKEMGEFVDVRDESGAVVAREPKFSWCYVVQSGERLYPFGRRIIFTRYGVLEDGPSHFHSGMFPVCKVTLDSWAWSWMGSSPIQPLLSLQRSVDDTARVIQDYIARVGEPGSRYDRNALPAGLARKLNTRAPGMKVAHNAHAGKPFELLAEPPLAPTVPEWLKFLLDSMDELSGIAALKNLSQLNQIPSTETIDKIIESMTPLVRARSRALEHFIREFAMMLASIIMQHYTLDLRLRILGADGVTPEDFNYRAGDMLPDYINDDDYEDVPDGQGGVVTRVRPEVMQRGPSPDFIRNREFLRFLSFEVAPGTLLDAATITKKLLYLQLARMGLVDHWTLLEVMQVPNVGNPPEWATDITLRLQAEKMMGLGILASTVGRPPTAQAMPSMTPSGAISESG